MVSGICTTRKLLHLICSRLDGFRPSVNLLLLLVHVIKSIICTVCTNYSFQVPFNVIQKLSCQWWNNTCFWLAKTYLSPLICWNTNLCYSVYPICTCPMCCKKSWSRWSAHSRTDLLNYDCTAGKPLECFSYPSSLPTLSLWSATNTSPRCACVYHDISWHSIIRWQSNHGDCSFPEWLIITLNCMKYKI